MEGLFILFLIALWIGGVVFFYSMAVEEEKDPTLVLVLGIFFGPIGAVIGYAVAKPEKESEAPAREESEVERLRRQLAEAEARSQPKTAPKKKEKPPEPDVYEL